MTSDNLTTINILGTNIGVLNLDSATSLINTWLKAENRNRYICVTGVHGIMEGFRNHLIQNIHNKADVCVPDGMPTVWFGKKKGHKEMGRVYGPDLMLKVMAMAEQEGYSHYFYGGDKGVADLLSSNMTTKFPKAVIAGTYSPPFHKLSDQEEADIVEQINKCNADILWVGLSTPKQEQQMADFQSKVNAKIMIGVGAAFDFHTGRVKQAPKWMQKAGLEWLFRLSVEPKRLWKRYLTNNPAFIFHAFLQLTGIRKYNI